MELTIVPLNLSAARQVAGWRYPPPYDVYDIGEEPLALATMIRPGAGYHAILAGEELVGFCCFGEEARVPGGDYSAPAVDVGLGVRPDLTGRGQGRHVFDAVTLFAERAFRPPALRLTVAAFNKRAIRLYQNAGFRETERFAATFSGRPFLIMVRAAHPA